MFDVWHLRYVVLMESSARSLSIVRNKFKPHRKSPASYASQILRAHRSCELGLQPCLRRRHAQADRRELWGWLLMTNRASAVQQRERAGQAEEWTDRAGYCYALGRKAHCWTAKSGCCREPATPSAPKLLV